LSISDDLDEHKPDIKWTKATAPEPAFLKSFSIIKYRLLFSKALSVPFLKLERNEAAVKWSAVLETDIECVTV